MSDSNSQQPPSQSSSAIALPAKPDLTHLKSQARELHKNGKAPSLSSAQYQIAKLYGFGSWPKLKSHVESLSLVWKLKAAIDSNDFEAVKQINDFTPRTAHCTARIR